MELEIGIFFAESRLIVSLVSKFSSIRRVICPNFCMDSLKFLVWIIAFCSLKDTVFARLNGSVVVLFFSFDCPFVYFLYFGDLFMIEEFWKLFFQFCWNLSQFSTRIASTCGYWSVSVSFLVSLLFSGLSLFYVVSLSFKRQTFSFTASSTSLPDSLLLLLNLPLNVNHSEKRSVIFYSDGSNRKIFLQKNGGETYKF